MTFHSLSLIYLGLRHKIIPLALQKLETCQSCCPVLFIACLNSNTFGPRPVSSTTRRSLDHRKFAVGRRGRKFNPCLVLTVAIVLNASALFSLRGSVRLRIRHNFPIKACIIALPVARRFRISKARIAVKLTRSQHCFNSLPYVVVICRVRAEKWDHRLLRLLELQHIASVDPLHLIPASSYPSHSLHSTHLHTDMVDIRGWTTSPRIEKPE